MTGRRARGFTLIELMVAMVISMIAVLALLEAWSATRQTYRVQAMQLRLTEDGRFALSMLGRIISQAGFRPSPALPMPTDRVTIDPGGSGVRVRFTADGANQAVCDGAVAPAGDFTLAIRRNNTSLGCGITAATPPVPGVGALIEWLGPAVAGGGNGTEVADFRLLYGVDNGPAGTVAAFGCGPITGNTTPRDCVADAYRNTLLAGETPDQIVAIRLCLILRSENTDGSLVKPAPVRDCTDNGTIAGSQGDRKLYRSFHSTILLKNR